MEQAASFEPLRDLVEEIQSTGARRLLREHSAEDISVPMIPLSIMLVGFVVLGCFLFREYNIAVNKQASTHTTLPELVAYRLDYHFSASKAAKPLLLLAISFVLIVLSTFGCAFVGEDLGAAMWASWLYVADPGTHADAEGTGLRVVAFSTTMGGMCVFALMVGIISDFLGEKMDDLKKGKSRIIESGHTVMLGWSGRHTTFLLCFRAGCFSSLFHKTIFPYHPTNHEPLSAFRPASRQWQKRTKTR